MAYQNFFAAKLFTDIGSSDTTITLDTAPTATSGRMVLEARNPTQREIISYTGVSGNQLTGVTRGIGGTTAKSHLKNALVEMNVTAQDLQDLYDAFTSFSATNNDWRTVVGTPVFSSNVGNKSYVVNVPSDVTAAIPVGAKVRIPRTGTVPTQSIGLVAASSQYAGKVSPTGITFTTAFTVEAKVYLNSYTGANQFIVDRENGSAGWGFYISASGQLEIYYGGSGFTTLVAYGAVPLKRWVHIAGVISSVSGQLGALYINGAAIPFTTVSGSTILTQPATDLRIGTYGNTPSGFVDGNLADVRVWSVAQTQAQILANMDVSLTTAANLVLNIPGNGNFTDLSGNGNSMTASNGAIATSPSNSQNSVEFGIVTKVGAYSGGVTPLTIFTGTDCAIPNATLGTLQYSTSRSPFGFPTDRGKWVCDVIIKNDITISSPAQNTWYNYAGGALINLPTGAWRLLYEGGFYATRGGSTVVTLWVSLSTTTNSESEPLLSSFQQNEGAVGQMTAFPTFHREKYLNVATPTIYSLVTKTSVPSVTSLTLFGSFIPTVITAECAYL